MPKGKLRTIVARFRKRIVFTSLTLILLTFLFTPVSFYKHRRTYCCPECLSKLNKYQWTFGLDGFSDFPITPQWQAVEISKTFQNFLPTNHQHNWVFAQGSPYRLGYIWSGCSLGASENVSEIGEMYESSGDFRTYLAGLEEEKKMTHDEILAMLVMPGVLRGSQTNNPEFQRLAENSKRVLDDYFKH